MVAETSTLDALRILYVFLSFSHSDSMNSAYILESPELGMCVDAQIPNGVEVFFCVWSQKPQHWVLCVSAMF